MNGRLPPEVIKRIVRQNFGRFRHCYLAGLRSTPNLQDRVTVKFVIDDEGAARDAKDGGSDLPNSSAAACVVRGLPKLSFPLARTARWASKPERTRTSTRSLFG